MIRMVFRLNEKIDGLINLLSNEFGRKIVIASSTHETSEPKESALRQSLQEEKIALHNLAAALQTKHCDEAEAHRKFVNAQYKTDLAHLDILKSN